MLALLYVMQSKDLCFYANGTHFYYALLISLVRFIEFYAQIWALNKKT